MKDLYVNVKEIPQALQDALQQIGYHRKDIQVKASEEVDVTCYGGDGMRGIAIAVDLASNRISNIARGSWGGPNPFETNPLDVNGALTKIPVNGAVITGIEGGGKPTYAVVSVHPDSLAKWLPSGGDDVTEKESWALEIFASLKSCARKDELDRYKITSQEIDGLVERGYLKRNKSGATSITTKGKNKRSGRLPYVGY